MTNYLRSCVEKLLRSFFFVRLKTNECSFDLARDFSAMLNVTSMLHTLFFMAPKRITKSRELVTFFSKYADMDFPEFIRLII